MSKLISRRSAIIAGVATIVVVGGLAALYWAYHKQVQETIRTEVLHYIREKADLAVEESGGGSIDITFSSFAYGFFTQDLDINGIRVRYSDSTEQRGERLDISAQTVECTGLSPIDVIWGKGLSLGDISVDSLDIDYRIWNADTTIAQVVEPDRKSVV